MNLKKIKRLIPGGLSLAISFLSLSPNHVDAATILVDDQFVDAGFTDGTDVLDAAWSGTNATLSVGAYTTSPGINLTNALKYVPTSFSNVGIGAFTNASELAIGETMTLTLDFRLTASVDQSSTTMRFGLGSSSNTYSFRFGVGPGTPGSAVAETPVNAIFGAASNSYTVTGTPLGISASTTNTINHTFALSFTRDDDDTISFAADVDGNLFSAVTSNAISNFTFDRIVLGQGSTDTQYNLDNISVVVVPEPSTNILLIGACLSLMLIFRRCTILKPQYIRCV